MKTTFWRLTKKDYYGVAIELQKHLPQLKSTYCEEIAFRLKGCNIEFYYTEKAPIELWIRLTMPFAFIVIVFLWLWLPFNFLITGYWRYKSIPLTNWLTKLKLI